MLHPRTAMFVLELGSMEATHAEVKPFVSLISSRFLPLIRAAKIWNEMYERYK